MLRASGMCKPEERVAEAPGTQDPFYPPDAACRSCTTAPTRLEAFPLERGRSSGVEHNLAKVGVEGSNPFARSRFSNEYNC